MEQSGYIGARARGRRLELGLKQTDVARKVGISPAYLNLIEHNRRRIGDELLPLLADALDTTNDALVMGAAPLVVERVLDIAGRAGAHLDAALVQNFVERFPAIAELVTGHDSRLQVVEATLESLSDRLSHDPFFSDTIHEIVSTVSSIRSTSSILLEGDGMDPGLDRRFRENIHTDSLRLASATQGLADFLNFEDDPKSDALSAHDEVFQELDKTGFHHPDLEDGTIDAPGFVQRHFPHLSPVAQKVGADYAATYQRHARILPKQELAAAVDRFGLDPQALVRHLDTSFSVLLRRLAAMPSEVTDCQLGLVVVDVAGRVLHRQSIDIFEIPRAGAVCAHWPVFRALRQPDVPALTTLSQIRRVAAGATTASSMSAYSCAESFGVPELGAVQNYRGVMLLIPHEDATANVDGRVGTSCRVCQHASCSLRGEPSILSDGF